MEDIRQYKPVRDFLLDISIYDDLEKVAEKHQVAVERVDEFLQLTDAVVKGGVSPDQMPPMLAQAFGLDTEKATALAADIAGHVLLPLENYLPGIADIIKQWGAKIEDYPEKRIGKEETSPERFIEDLAKRLGLELPEHLMKRFVYLARGYLTKDRAREATKKILTRPTNIGGLEFTEDMAENFFRMLDSESEKFKLIQKKDEEEIHPEVSKAVQPSEKTEEHPGPSSAKPDKSKDLQEKDEPSALVAVSGPPAPDKGIVFKEGGPKTVEEHEKEVKSEERETEQQKKKPRNFLSKGDLLKRVKALLPEKKKEIKKGLDSWDDVTTVFADAIKEQQQKTAGQRDSGAVEVKSTELVEKKAVELSKKESPVKPAAKMKEEVESEVNMLLAPVVEAFRAKERSSVAFKDISLGYIKEGRSVQKTKEILTEVHGFTDKEAAHIIKALDAAKATAMKRSDFAEAAPAQPPRPKIVSKRTPLSKEPPLKYREDEDMRASQVTALTTSVPVVSGLELQKEEEEEIRAHEKAIKRKGLKEADEHSASVQKGVNQALQPMAEVFKKKKIPKRTFSEIARAHVRGVRDDRQTERLLTMKYKIEGDDLEKVMKALKDARGVVEEEAKKRTNIPESTDIFGDEQEGILEQEREVLDRRHAKITKEIPGEPVEPVSTSAKVSAARSKKEELELQKAKVSDEDVEEAEVASKPKLAKTKVSSPTVLPGGSAKKVTDVTYSKKLVGPVDELGTMQPVEFRRLSSDPKEAVRKVMDKLDLLEATSYEDRIRGVKAWRKSPVNRLYLEIATEALQSGKSLAEIAAERRNAGKESLSPAEVQAVVDLNSRIKF